MESLGPLELRVMEIVWRRGRVTASDVRNELSKDRRVALTTVITTLNRLYEKGFLERRIVKGRGGLKYVFTPIVSRDVFAKNFVRNIVEKMGRGIVMALVREGVKELSVEQLDNLLEEIERLKREKHGD